MNFVEKHFNVLALFTLLMILILCHVVMMAKQRPMEMIQWVENMISAAEGALVVMLSGALAKEPKQ